MSADREPLVDRELHYIHPDKLPPPTWPAREDVERPGPDDDRGSDDGGSGVREPHPPLPRH
jgi:hypothetical protein